MRSLFIKNRQGPPRKKRLIANGGLSVTPSWSRRPSVLPAFLSRLRVSAAPLSTPLLHCAWIGAEWRPLLALPSLSHHQNDAPLQEQHSNILLPCAGSAGVLMPE